MGKGADRLETVRPAIMLLAWLIGLDGRQGRRSDASPEEPWNARWRELQPQGRKRPPGQGKRPL